MEIKRDAVAVVTGGVQAWGWHDHQGDCRRGAKVVILDLPRGDDVVKDLRQPVRFVEAPSSTDEEVSAALDAAETLGPVRIVNCAGTGDAIRRPVQGRVVPARRFAGREVNLVGTFNVIRWRRADERQDGADRGSAASSSTPPRSRRSRGQIGRLPIRRPRAAWSA